MISQDCRVNNREPMKPYPANSEVLVNGKEHASEANTERFDNNAKRDAREKRRIHERVCLLSTPGQVEDREKGIQY